MNGQKENTLPQRNSFEIHYGREDLKDRKGREDDGDSENGKQARAFVDKYGISVDESGISYRVGGKTEKYRHEVKNLKGIRATKVDGGVTLSFIQGQSPGYTWRVTLTETEGRLETRVDDQLSGLVV